MLTKIEIENYRGIRKGTVDGFSAVNIFVGPNGSGKSTLLETIFLGVDRNKSNNKFWGWPHSNERPLLGVRHNEYSFPSQEAIWGKSNSERVSVLLVFSDGTSMRSSFSSGTQQGSISHFPDPNEDGVPDPLYAGPMLPPVPRSSANRTNDSNVIMNKFFSKVKLFDMRMLLDKEMDSILLDSLFEVRADRLLISKMNEIYGLNIEALTFSRGSDKLKLLFTDKDFPLCVDDLGAGMRIAFRLMMAVSDTTDSALLFEEFDGYQHVDTIPLFTKALLSLANESRTQLFLTTHSLETVRAFVDAAKDAPNEKSGVVVFQTELSSGGFFKTARLSAEECITLLDGDFDLRRSR